MSKGGCEVVFFLLSGLPAAMGAMGAMGGPRANERWLASRARHFCLFRV